MRTVWWATALGALLAAALAKPAIAQTPLASGGLRIQGVELVVSPANQTVPKNQATGLTTALVDPAKPTASVADPSLTSLVVKGELSGPSLDTLPLPAGATRDERGIITLSALAGQLLPIPALLATGNYVVDNLRLERCTGGDACATVCCDGSDDAEHSRWADPADSAAARYRQGTGGGRGPRRRVTIPRSEMSSSA